MRYRDLIDPAPEQLRDEVAQAADAANVRFDSIPLLRLAHERQGRYVDAWSRLVLAWCRDRASGRLLVRLGRL